MPFFPQLNFLSAYSVTELATFYFVIMPYKKSQG